MSEPFSRKTDDTAVRKQAEFRRLVKAYAATFSSAHGRLVLADLKRKFGFDRWEAESEALSDNTIARRVCMKGPIFHIEKMRTHIFRKAPKSTKALSGNTHEQTETPV
jgi:hypothetical protein